MALKLILSDERYQTFVRKWVRADFAANDFFDKYIDILPPDLLEIAWKKRVDLSKKYHKIVENSIRISEIK